MTDRIKWGILRRAPHNREGDNSEDTYIENLASSDPHFFLPSRAMRKAASLLKVARAIHEGQIANPLEASRLDDLQPPMVRSEGGAFRTQRRLVSIDAHRTKGEFQVVLTHKVKSGFGAPTGYYIQIIAHDASDNSGVMTPRTYQTGEIFIGTDKALAQELFDFYGSQEGIIHWFEIINDHPINYHLHGSAQRIAYDIGGEAVGATHIDRVGSLIRTVGEAKIIERLYGMKIRESRKSTSGDFGDMRNYAGKSLRELLDQWKANHPNKSFAALADLLDANRSGKGYGTNLLNEDRQAFDLLAYTILQDGSGSNTPSTYERTDAEIRAIIDYIRHYGAPPERRSGNHPRGPSLGFVGHRDIGTSDRVMGQPLHFMQAPFDSKTANTLKDMIRKLTRRGPFNAGSEGLPETPEEFFGAMTGLYSPSNVSFETEAAYYQQEDIDGLRDIEEAGLSNGEQAMWDHLVGTFDKVFQRSELRNTGSTFRSSFRLFDSPENSTITIMRFGNRTVFYVNRRFLTNLVRLSNDLKGNRVIGQSALPRELSHLPAVNIIDSILYGVAFHEMGHHWGAKTKATLADGFETRYMTDADEAALQTFRGGKTYGLFNTAAYRFYLHYAGIPTHVIDEAIRALPFPAERIIQETLRSISQIVSAEPQMARSEGQQGTLSGSDDVVQSQKVFNNDEEMYHELTRFKASFLFLGHGSKSQFHDVEATLKEVDSLVEEYNALYGKGQWVAVFGGDGYNETKPDIAHILKHLKDHHKVPILAIQSDIVEKKWGGVDKYIDYVRYVPTQMEADGKTVIWGGLRDGKPVGPTAVYLGDQFASGKSGLLKGVVTIGGGPIALGETQYAYEKGIPITYVRARTKYQEINGEFGSLDEWVSEKVKTAINNRVTFSLPEASPRMARSEGRFSRLWQRMFGSKQGTGNEGRSTNPGGLSNEELQDLKDFAARHQRLDLARDLGGVTFIMNGRPYLVPANGPTNLVYLRDTLSRISGVQLPDNTVYTVEGYSTSDLAFVIHPGQNVVVHSPKQAKGSTIIVHVPNLDGSVAVELPGHEPVALDELIPKAVREMTEPQRESMRHYLSQIPSGTLAFYVNGKQVPSGNIAEPGDVVEIKAGAATSPTGFEISMMATDHPLVQALSTVIGESESNVAKALVQHDAAASSNGVPLQKVLQTVASEWGQFVKSITMHRDAKGPDMIRVTFYAGAELVFHRVKPLVWSMEGPISAQTAQQQPGAKNNLRQAAGQLSASDVLRIAGDEESAAAGMLGLHQMESSGQPVFAHQAAFEMAQTLKQEFETPRWGGSQGLTVSEADLEIMERYLAGEISLAQAVTEIYSMAESDSAKLLIAGKVSLENNFYAVGRSALLAFLAGNRSEAEIATWAKNLTHDGNKPTLDQAKNILRQARRQYNEVTAPDAGPTMARSEGKPTLARSEATTTTFIMTRFLAAVKALVRPIINFFRRGWLIVRNYFSSRRAIRLGRKTVIGNLSNTPEVEGIPLPIASSNELGEVADAETARQARAQRAGLLAEAMSA